MNDELMVRTDDTNLLFSYNENENKVIAIIETDADDDKAIQLNLEQVKLIIAYLQSAKKEIMKNFNYDE